MLFCVAMIAVVLIAQGALLGKGGDFFAALQQRLEQIKEALLHFIFIEEADDEYEEEVKAPAAKAEPLETSKKKAQPTPQRAEPNPTADKKVSVQQKQPKQRKKGAA